MVSNATIVPDGRVASWRSLLSCQSIVPKWQEYEKLTYLVDKVQYLNRICKLIVMSGKGIFSLILGAAVWLIAQLLHDEDWKKVSIGVFSAGFLELLGYLWENRKHWKMMKLQFIHPRRAIRVTTAYLYRIEYNGKYLL